ncbi:MAG: Lrp/AsnC family transcriptional regulator [Bacillota bacterium]|nr:Lrp/AsnC family transcriptional regulator [Bacillota bacterium]
MKKLLELLSENARLTTTELSFLLNEPEEKIKAQIAEYEEKGIIKGYRTLINWEKVPNAGVTALIELKVTPKKETGFDEIAQSVMSFDEVESVYLIAGVYDLAVFVKGNTIQEVASFVSKKLSALDSVISTATHFLLKRYKDGGVSFAETEREEDKRGLIL